jgi:hypothetical protein
MGNLVVILKKLFGDQESKTILHEFKTTVLLLCCSSLVGQIVHTAPFAASLRTHFETAHEWGTIAMWVIFFGRALLRMLIRPLKK